MAAWAVAFYFIMTDEINDETDDTLEDYAHHLITRTLAGEELPSEDNGTNNTYYLTEVSEEYAAQYPSVRYADETVYIWSKMETEPARVLKTIFRDSDDRVFELAVAIPSYEKIDLQQRILWWILILYAMLLAAVIAVNAWIVRRSFRPLYVLLEWLDDVRLGEKMPTLDNGTDITEFRRLNEAMIRTARRGNEMFDEQRLFTGNAAHELQTPIAVCRTKLELLANDPSLGEGHLEQIASVLGTLDRLAGLNRTLLLLARIDNHGFTDSMEIDAGVLVRRLAEDYSEVYGHKNLTVDINQDTVLKVGMNETLASVLCGNLLKNAFVHSPEGGRIEVKIASGTLSVSNDARGGPLDPVVIFRRFYRSANQEGSVGLGLALVESICRLYGLSVRYDFAEGRHIFSVAF
jgi:signal transduction histidine kinase